MLWEGGGQRVVMGSGVVIVAVCVAPDWGSGKGWQRHHQWKRKPEGHQSLFYPSLLEERAGSSFKGYVASSHEGS